MLPKKIQKWNWEDQISAAVSEEGMVRQGGPRLTIPYSIFRAESKSERVRTDPSRHLRALEEAAHKIASNDSTSYQKSPQRIKVSISGPILAAPSSPRQLTSANLRQFVCVEGVATKVSMIKPKVVSSAHYCSETNLISRRNYVDNTDPYLNLPQVDAEGDELPDKFIQMTTSIYPTKDADMNPLETEYGLSVYKDHQTISLQEMPEKAPLGQLPRSVELLIDHDLVDRIKPGDRVMITGVYRALASKTQNTGNAYNTGILVNHVQIMGRNASQMTFRSNDIPRFRSLGKRTDILNILGNSVAPSIHGHEHIKRAVALQLLSGVEKNLENGTHLRGDINILMVGDPSTAKSQLLRASMTIAPLAVSTTGKGSSGVGLTAAVTSDPDTRERRLEAGAMVLADRGLVCVDEFDKMSEADRVAIHEAMEQQTVTIAKAGIHASLNARCAVLAAANPVYGQYDKTARVTENIGLPDSLLSRFDLLFIVLDQLDPELDRQIATHVLTGHQSRYQPDHHLVEDDDDEAFRMWRKENEILTLDFLRKYIHYAKNRRKPVLTEAVREMIATRYAELRASQSDIAVTARSLETIIRLSTAHAKARLSETVELMDVDAALEILKFALFHENVGASNTDSETIVTDDDDEAEETISPPTKRPRLDDGKSLQRSIWEILGQNGEAMSTAQLEKALPDQNLKEALEALQANGQIAVSDGMVYTL